MKYLREMITTKFHPKDVMETLVIILRLSKKIELYINIMLKETGLTLSQFTVLQMLGEKDGRSLHEFSEFCNCAPATMTGIVDTLERKELVLRKHSEDDRRSVLVYLTSLGRKKIEAAPTYKEIFKSCCLNVADINVKELNSYLKKIDNALSVNQKENQNE